MGLRGANFWRWEVGIKRNDGIGTKGPNYFGRILLSSYVRYATVGLGH